MTLVRSRPCASLPRLVTSVQGSAGAAEIQILDGEHSMRQRRYLVTGTIFVEVLLSVSAPCVNGGPLSC